MIRPHIVFFSLVLLLLGFCVSPTHRLSAASLTFVSDLIGTSVAATSTSHRVQFTTTGAIPTSGVITITPQQSAFSIPVDFDYTDVDLAVATGAGAYVDRDLAALPSASEDGVTVIPGGAGYIKITLSSGSGISAGDRVRVLLGTNAIYGVMGSTSIINPSLDGSYRIGITTATASNVQIDNAFAMIAIIPTVLIGLNSPIVEPTRSNGLPSGDVAAGNSTIELSLNTDLLSTCRYATSSGMVYGDMTGTFNQTSSTLHSVVLSGFQNSTTYTYYVRCADQHGTLNEDDYSIMFTLLATPSSNTSIASSGGGGGGMGSFPGGSSLLYQSSVSVAGFTSPLSTVDILKDGKKAGTTQSRADGTFKFDITGLERGLYTFSAYSTDSKQRVSAPFSATLSVESGTSNTLSNSVIPPTLALEKTSINPGEKITISGEATPGASLEIAIFGSGVESNKIVKQLATSTPNVPGLAGGKWEVIFDSSSLPRGVYTVKARTIRGTTSRESTYGKAVLLGVGQSTGTVGSGQSDVNSDGKVNLRDFSILLSSWGTDNAGADLNKDGKVNLADVSILLFNWTG